MGAPMAMVGMGSSVVSGILGMSSAGVKAQGDKLSIQGQMLATMGKAFQFDAEAQQYTYKSNAELYQAAVARINKDIAKSNATYEREIGEVSAQQAGMKARADLGTAIAYQGASGISVSSGTATRVREGMIDIGYQNQAVIRANAAKTAYGYEVQATQFEAEAGLHDYASTMNLAQAENAKTAAGITREALPLEQEAMGLADKAGSINAMASLVGATGSVANKWTQGNFTFGNTFGSIGKMFGTG